MKAYFEKTGKKTLIWWRYIDDIYFIWTDGEESLKGSLDHVQHYSKNVNSALIIDMIHLRLVNLDVTVQLKDGKIITII